VEEGHESEQPVRTLRSAAPHRKALTFLADALAGLRLEGAFRAALAARRVLDHRDEAGLAAQARGLARSRGVEARQAAHAIRLCSERSVRKKHGREFQTSDDIAESQTWPLLLCAEPGGHAVQNELFPNEYEPGSQSLQAVAPVVCCARPGGQPTHTAWPG